MKRTILALLVSMFPFIAFGATARCQAGGEAFSNEVTAGTGETTINSSSSPSKDFTVEEIYWFDTQDQRWKPCEDWEFATTPAGAHDEHASVFSMAFRRTGSTRSSTPGRRRSNRT
ncbi:MAG: hypothetical protein ACE37K_22385 [Planctomycetota bacterium]